MVVSSVAVGVGSAALVVSGEDATFVSVCVLVAAVSVVLLAAGVAADA